MTFDRFWHIARLRLRSLFSGAAVDRELDEELRFHVERQIEQLVAEGMTPGQARTRALRAIGGVEQRKEEMRDARGVSIVESLAQDLRFAARQLRKQPGFAATAVVSLALGIGANTAIFQLLNALSLRALPVRAPHELAEVRLTGDGRDGRHTGRNRQVSLPQYQEIDRRQQVRVHAGIRRHAIQSVAVRGGALRRRSLGVGVVLFGGLLFLRTFRNLSTQDVGVHERGVVVASVFFGDRAYPPERRRQAYRELDERIFNLPGVRSAAEAYTTPMGGSIWDTDVETDRGLKGFSNGNRVGPRYFETLGTRLLAGRDFTDADVPGAPRLAIVNQSFAARFFDGDPLGRRFVLPHDGGGPGQEFVVVGLVADQKYIDLRQERTRIFFTASAQEPEPSTTRR